MLIKRHSSPQEPKIHTCLLRARDWRIIPVGASKVKAGRRNPLVTQEPGPSSLILEPADRQTPPKAIQPIPKHPPKHGR